MASPYPCDHPKKLYIQERNGKEYPVWICLKCKYQRTKERQFLKLIKS
jgi:Zn-finger protein